MAKSFLRRWMIACLMILILIGLGMIQAWLIRSVPLNKTREAGVTHAESEMEQFRRADGRVTLLPPYTEWKWDKDNPEPRIRVGSAVRAVCLQSGIHFDGRKLRRNAGPTLNLFVAPVVEDMSPEDALDVILTPVNLTYEIVDNSIVVHRVEDYLEPTQRLVTLKPPFTSSKAPGTKGNRISLQYAVIGLGQQAGIDYNWDKSYENTNPICRSWVYPNIEGMPFEDAMEEILRPKGLTYEIQYDQIVLMRRDDEQEQSYSDEEVLERTQRLVTLKPPYTGWKASSTKGSKIALQYAVMAIGQQAGIDYNWNKSFKNTDPICRTWIHPNIENMPFEEAMGKILGPKGLTYVIEGNQIVLTKRKKGGRQLSSGEMRQLPGSKTSGFRTRRVSLKPPYTGWNPDKRDRGDEIAVRAAVGAICRQAGIGFDDEQSYDNTSPLCEQRISPSIDRGTWEAAMEDILAPVGLDYTVENGKVVLVR